MLSFETTSEVRIPKDPFDRIIGQDHAIEIARIAAKQKRHLLLVAPPGTGKSLIANAIASILPKPKTQIEVLENKANPDRPVLRVRNKYELERIKKSKNRTKLLDPREVPIYVSEQLGFRCRKCGQISDPEEPICIYCGHEKYSKFKSVEDLLLNDNVTPKQRLDRVNLKKKTSRGKVEEMVYEREGTKVKVYKKKNNLELSEENVRKKVLVSVNRNTFVQATGASESELLGDVRHDPYGGHPEIGVPSFMRVVPGAIHEAHEGVLFIDELSTLGDLQRYILTAMQEKHFPIMGRSPTSTGASVRVNKVPCDFILVAAVNINDIQGILPPLRSRIVGSGYEVLLNTYMEDNEQNRNKMFQFIAQEVVKDGKIPHFDYEAAMMIISESKRRARELDGKDGLTLRLRDLSGIVKMAGDIAIMEEAELVNKPHVLKAVKRSKPVEEQLMERYGSIWKAGMSDFAALSRKYNSGEGVR